MHKQEAKMVKAIIDINKRANMVLNVVKAKYGLRDKSEAIEVVIEQYEEEILEPELKPTFIEKMGKIRKEPVVAIGTMNNFKKRYGTK
jgi:hypothetical protein